MDRSILFLPGLLCTSSIFDGQKYSLPEGFSFVDSELPNKNTMREIAEIIWERLMGNHIICGFSLGGIIAMEMFRQRPERVDGLILMDTNALDENDIATSVRQTVVNLASEISPGRVSVDFLLENQIHRKSRNRDDIKELMYSMAESYGFNKLSNHADALSSRRDYSQTLVKLKCPALILYGDEDKICPRDRQDHLMNLMPHAQRAIIKEAGHLSSLEQPRAVSKEINQWINRHFSEEL